MRSSGTKIHMRYARKALSDTWAAFGGLSLVVFVLAVPFVGFALHYMAEGYTAMMGEVEIWLLYGAAATGIVFSGLFLWNLACAPYRLERQARLQVEAELGVLMAREAPAQRRLTPTQKQDAISALGGLIDPKDEVMIWSFQNEECLAFSDDFREVFQKAGAKEVSVQTNMIGGPIPADYRDLMIVQYANTSDQLTRTLSDLLSGFGLKHDIHTDRKTKSNEAIRLLVSRPS